MVFRVVAAVALVVLAILVIAAFRTGTVQIQRSRSIQAPPDKVFALINDFHNWKQWAPQDVEDPTMKRNIQRSRTWPRCCVGVERFRKLRQRKDVDR
jgi:hypothetical protein